MPHRPKKQKHEQAFRKHKKTLLKLKFDEREMITQRIDVRRDSGEIVGSFYIARHYGERDCWLEIKVLSSDVQKEILSDSLLYRELDADGNIIKIVPIEWLLDKYKPDLIQRKWLERLSTAFDFDNSKGQLTGTMLFHN